MNRRVTRWGSLLLLTFGCSHAAPQFGAADGGDGGSGGVGHAGMSVTFDAGGKGVSASGGAGTIGTTGEDGGADAGDSSTAGSNESGGSATAGRADSRGGSSNTNGAGTANSSGNCGGGGGGGACLPGACAKTDAGCGASCAACGGGTPKCQDLGATSQCVACLSDGDCGSAAPLCNPTTNVCYSPPSCTGLAATCGASGKASCCASNGVTGGRFNRGNDPSYPATVSDFRLDNYEITVGRFREFWLGYPGNLPAAGSGKNANNPSDPGWDASWNTSSLPLTQAALTTALQCNAARQTWTDPSGTAAGEHLPIDCLSWYEADAFCIWDGGRLPTEAEWNYAAAGGMDQRVYPWGSSAPDCTYLNFYAVPPGSGGCGAAVAANQVGTESPKGDGLFGQSDLSGNVFEWVQDWYADSYLAGCNNCTNTTAAASRVIRGGGFSFSASSLLTSNRDSSDPSSHQYPLGARCARAL